MSYFNMIGEFPDGIQHAPKLDKQLHVLGRAKMHLSHLKPVAYT